MDTTMFLDSSMPVIESAPTVEIAGDTAFLAALMSFFATYALVICALAVITIIAMWIIYKKANKPGWASIVPIYNAVVLFQIVGLSPWLLLLGLIPVVGWIALAIIQIVIAFRLAKSFGKDIGWGFGLWLLPQIFYLILAFGKSEYVGPNGEAEGQTVEAKVTDEE